MTLLQTDTRRVAELITYERNAKAHPASQVAAIAASISRFGFKDPIGITANNVIIEGHGRLMAAQSLGLEEVPVLIFPAEMDQDAIDLYRIAHNRLALLSTFDFPLLVDQLREITANTASFEQMGFSQASADSLFEMFSGAPAPRNETQNATSGTNPTAGGAGEANSASNPNALAFDIVWDNAEQRDRWKEFMAGVQGLQPDATRGAALTNFLGKVMRGEIEACAEHDAGEPTVPPTAEDVGDLKW